MSATRECVYMPPGHTLHVGRPIPPPACWGLPSALTYLGAFAFVVVLGGPLFEEPGWRGFALSRQLHGPLIGASS